jgi:hypothetical protein
MTMDRTERGWAVAVRGRSASHARRRLRRLGRIRQLRESVVFCARDRVWTHIIVKHRHDWRSRALNDATNQ